MLTSDRSQTGIDTAQRSRSSAKVVSVVFALLVAAAGLAAVAVGFQDDPGERRASSSPRRVVASAPEDAIVIDPGVGETFSPAPASASPAMTAEQAWLAWTERNASDRTTIPPDVTVQLGLLTLPIGHSGPDGAMEYQAHDRMVWGYQAPYCGPALNPYAPPPDPPCTRWIFLDADTGEEVDVTWQG